MIRHPPIPHILRWLSLRRWWTQQALMGVGCLVVNLRTMAPSVYTLDGFELTAGAAVLGIVHPPGYPLYLLIVHVVMQLPIGDLAYRANLFSAVCLALTAPLLYHLLSLLLADRWVAAACALMFVWSRYIWLSGLFAEVYAPQLVTLALCGVLLRQQAGRTPTFVQSCVLGITLGGSVALVPSSMLFLPGVTITLLLLRVPRHRLMVIAGVSLLIYGMALVYFPVRYAAQPVYNHAGHYTAEGDFTPVNLQTVEGVWWMMRGARFEYLFFAHGYLPVAEIWTTIVWLWENTLGVGLIVGVAGAAVLWRRQRGLFIAWVTLFLPYTYFFTAYGATDRLTMQGPTYLLWTLPVAFGLRWFTEQASSFPRYVALLLLPLLFLGVNYTRVNLNTDTAIYAHTETLITALPPNAHVFGEWWEIVPLEYLQIVENQRPDLTFYNFFQFAQPDAEFFMAAHFEPAQSLAQHPVIVLSSAEPWLDRTRFDVIPFDVDSAGLDTATGFTGVYQVFTASNVPGSPETITP